MATQLRNRLLTFLVPLLLAACGSQEGDRPAASSEAGAAAPLHIISSFTEAGSSSRTIRILAPKLEEYLQRPIEIHYNEGGRGGDIGAQAAAAAPADQLTLFVGTVGNIALLPSILTDYQVEPLTDFHPLTQLTMTPDVLIAHSSLGVTTIDELVGYADQQDEPLTYSHIAPFSIHRMEFVEIIGALEIEAENDNSIRGSAAAMDAVANGSIDLAMTTAPYVAPLVEAGSVMPLAVANENRLSAYPDVLTMEEYGIPIPHGSWSGAFVPASTSAEDTNTLFQAVTMALNDSEVIAQLAELGMIAAPSASPLAFRTYIELEQTRLAAVARTYDIREN